MPTTDPDDTAELETIQRRCPVCWTRFTPNSPSNPYPRRYCCAACRIEDSRRRRENEANRLLLDAKLDVLRAARHAEDERRETTRLLRLLNERTDPMNND